MQSFLTNLKKNNPSDKVVIVSNFTSTLDIIASLANNNHWDFLRLDGSVPANKRQGLVDLFNINNSYINNNCNSSVQVRNIYLFLLSAKAGGVGINL